MRCVRLVTQPWIYVWYWHNTGRLKNYLYKFFPVAHRADGPYRITWLWSVIIFFPFVIWVRSITKLHVTLIVFLLKQSSCKEINETSVYLKTIIIYFKGTKQLKHDNKSPHTFSDVTGKYWNTDWMFDEISYIWFDWLNSHLGHILMMIIIANLLSSDLSNLLLIIIFLFRQHSVYFFKMQLCPTALTLQIRILDR